MKHFRRYLLAATAAFLGCVVLGDDHGPGTGDLQETHATAIVERNPFHDNAKMVPASFAETVRLRARTWARLDSFDRIGFSARDADVLREVARIDTGVVLSAASDASRHLLVELCSLPEDAVLKRGVLYAEFDRRVKAALPATISVKLTELTPEGASVLAEVIGKDRAMKLDPRVDAAALAFEDREFVAKGTVAMCERGGF